MIRKNLNMKKILMVIGILVMLVVAIFISKGSFFTGNAVKEEVKEFTIKAFRFGYSPDVIEINRGDNVKIIIENTDTLHGIRIPDLEIKGNDVVEFTADKQGEFDWYCNNMCGEGHMQMRGKLIVK